MIYSLSDLKRYNNKIKCKQESVAEHMYFCGYILLKLHKYLIITEIEFSQLLQYILIHDVGEVISGDLPYNVKADSPELHALVDKIEDDYIIKMGFSDTIEYMKADNHSHLFKMFKLVDTLQVIQYCKNELLLGNASKEIKIILDTAIEICNKIVNESDEFYFEKNSFDLNEFIETNF